MLVLAVLSRYGRVRMKPFQTGLPKIGGFVTGSSLRARVAQDRRLRCHIYNRPSRALPTQLTQEMLLLSEG